MCSCPRVSPDVQHGPEMHPCAMGASDEPTAVPSLSGDQSKLKVAFPSVSHNSFGMFQNRKKKCHEERVPEVVLTLSQSSAEA